MDFDQKAFDQKAVVVQEDGTQAAKFSYDFVLGGKAVEMQEDEHGDLWIEGYASDFGVDRQNEAFEPGAFERGLKAFLETNPIMLYHHKYDHALGAFTDAKVDENGLWVRGRVDKPATGSWAEDIFNKIKRGTIKSFSVGGIFKRRMTAQGPRIFDVDLGEISVTPFPVNPRTHFAVVAGKAFQDAPELEVVEEEPVVEDAPEADKPDEVEVDVAPEVDNDEGNPEADKDDAEEADEPEAVIEPGSITSDLIANGAINTEHLSDELRSRFSELKNIDELSAEEVQAQVNSVVSRLGSVFDQLGIRWNDTNDGPPQA